MTNTPAEGASRTRNSIFRTLVVAALLVSSHGAFADTPNAVIFEHSELRNRLRELEEEYNFDILLEP